MTAISGTRIALSSRTSGSGGMGKFARHLRRALADTGARCEFFDETIRAAPYPVEADLAIRHGYHQAGGGDLQNADFRSGTTASAAKNILLVPVDLTLLHSKPLASVGEGFGIFWFDSNWSLGRARLTGLQIERYGILPGPITPETLKFVDDSNGEFRFLHVVSGTPEVKGTDLVLRAFLLAVQRGSRAKLTIAVSLHSGLLERVERLARRHVTNARALERVSVQHGGQTSEQLTGLYQTSDCLVLASRSETFGLPAVEAAAAGLPVILHSECGVAEHRQMFAHTLVKGAWTSMKRDAWRNNATSEWFEVDIDSLAEAMLRVQADGPRVFPEQVPNLHRYFGTQEFSRRVEALVAGALSGT